MPFILRNRHGAFIINSPRDWERTPRAARESVSLDEGKTFSPYDSTDADSVRRLRTAVGLPVLPARPKPRPRTPLPDVDDLVAISERGWGDSWDGFRSVDEDGALAVDERDLVEPTEDVMVARVVATTPSTEVEEDSPKEEPANQSVSQQIASLRREVDALRSRLRRQEETIQALLAAQEKLQREVTELRQQKSAADADTILLPNLSLD
jgi:hypothetical protein